jgi:hypothetical protein
MRKPQQCGSGGSAYDRVSETVAEKGGGCSLIDVNDEVLTANADCALLVTLLIDVDGS